MHHKTQNKKQEIWVLDKNGDLFKIINRKLRFEMIGNFCAAFVTYENKQHLVKSYAGDLSDPFRRDETYLKKLYIQLKD